MPMLVTLDGYGSTGDIDDYLAFGPRADREARQRAMERYLAGDGTRALAFGCSPDIPCDQHGWSEAMAATRRRFGKDAPTRRWLEANPGKRWRTYYQFIISPAPEDRAGADEVAEIARLWCERCWPAGEGYQWIYSVHDDNAGRIMHAHVILNAVTAETGRKVQISRRWSDTLARGLQQIAVERGMRGMESPAARRRAAARERSRRATTQRRRESAAERALRSRGLRTWVGEIRDDIEACADRATGWGSFLDLLEDAGVSVEWSRNGIGFRHPESGACDMKVLGSTLGTDYTEEALRARVGVSFDDFLTGRPARRRDRGAVPTRTGPRLDRRAAGAPRRRTELARRLEGCALAGGRSAGRIARALATIEREGISERSALDGLVRARAERLRELESRAAELDAVAAVAREVLGRARELEAARSALAAQSDRPSSAAARVRREALVERSRAAAAACARGLEGASGFLASMGLDPSDPAACAAALERECAARAPGVRREAEAAREKLASAAEARETVEALVGARAPARARAGGRAQGRLAARLRPARAPSDISTRGWRELAAAAEEQRNRRITVARLRNGRIEREVVGAMDRPLPVAPGDGGGSRGGRCEDRRFEAQSRGVVT